MFRLRNSVEAVTLNGERLGLVEQRTDFEQWLDGIEFFRKSKPVEVKPNDHLHPMNGFAQIGEGTWRITQSPFALAVFVDTARRRRVVLAPIGHVKQVLEVTRSAP